MLRFPSPTMTAYLQGDGGRWLLIPSHPTLGCYNKPTKLHTVPFSGFWVWPTQPKLHFAPTSSKGHFARHLSC